MAKIFKLFVSRRNDVNLVTRSARARFRRSNMGEAATLEAARLGCIAG